jgi:hypothetical protein
VFLNFLHPIIAGFQARVEPYGMAAPLQAGSQARGQVGVLIVAVTDEDAQRSGSFAFQSTLPKEWSLLRDYIADVGRKG